MLGLRSSIGWGFNCGKAWTLVQLTQWPDDPFAPVPARALCFSNIPQFLLDLFDGRFICGHPDTLTKRAATHWTTKKHRQQPAVTVAGKTREYVEQRWLYPPAEIYGHKDLPMIFNRDATRDFFAHRGRNFLSAGLGFQTAPFGILGTGSWLQEFPIRVHGITWWPCEYWRNNGQWWKSPTQPIVSWRHRGRLRFRTRLGHAYRKGKDADCGLTALGIGPPSRM